MLPGFAAVRLTPPQERFCQLMAAGFDDDGNKLNQTECAIKAGIGNSKASSKTLAARYLKDKRFISRIKELEIESFGEMQIHNNEIIQGLRKVVQFSLGEKRLNRTVVDKQVDDAGSVTSIATTHQVYEPDLNQAHNTLKTMGTITGLITDKQKVEHSGGFALAGILSDIDGKTDGLPES